MISLKKYLDSTTTALSIPAPEPDRNDLAAVTMECYRAALLAVGKAAAQVSQGTGGDLEANLGGLERRLAVSLSAESMRKAELQVEMRLGEWGARTATELKVQADNVKELMLALARTAESVGNRDQGYAKKFMDLTARLERIADLNDLALMRASLVERVAELKSSVDQMTRENNLLVAQLRAEVLTCETKLRSAETLALKDQLTKVANRHSIEARIQWNIDNGQEICVPMLDLDNFKAINDSYGHLAGDDLLRQFALELQSNVRAGDMVGRWGGDEFIVILACDLTAALAQIARVQDWVFGKYTIRLTGKEAITTHVSGSIGAAEWHRGETLQQLIAEADANMFMSKKVTRRNIA